MQALVWIGAAISVAGLLGLIWCIVKAMAAKRAGLDDTALRARLQRLVIWNMGALLLSILGLMMIVAGIFLG